MEFVSEEPEHYVFYMFGQECKVNKFTTDPTILQHYFSICTYPLSERIYSSTISVSTSVQLETDEELRKKKSDAAKERKRIANKNRYMQNREKIKEQSKERYQKNRPLILKQKRDNYAENRPQRLEQKKQHYMENRPEILKKRREDYTENRPQILEQRREDYTENRPERLEERKQHYVENRPETIKTKDDRHYVQNADQRLLEQRKREDYAETQTRDY